MPTPGAVISGLIASPSIRARLRAVPERVRVPVRGADRERRLRRRRAGHEAHPRHVELVVAGGGDEQGAVLGGEQVDRLAHRVVAVRHRPAQAHVHDVRVVRHRPLHALDGRRRAAGAVVTEDLADQQLGVGGDPPVLPVRRGAGAGGDRRHVGAVADHVRDRVAPGEVRGREDPALEVGMRGVDAAVERGDRDALAGESRAPRPPVLRSGRRSRRASPRWGRRTTPSRSARGRLGGDVGPERVALLRDGPRRDGADARQRLAPLGPVGRGQGTVLRHAARGPVVDDDRDAVVVPLLDELADVEELQVELVLGEQRPRGRRHQVGVARLGERVRPVVAARPADQAGLLRAVGKRRELRDIAGDQGDPRGTGRRAGPRVGGRRAAGGGPGVRRRGGDADEYDGGGRECGADGCETHGSSRAGVRYASTLSRDRRAQRTKGVAIARRGRRSPRRATAAAPGLDVSLLPGAADGAS